MLSFQIVLATIGIEPDELHPVSGFPQNIIAGRIFFTNWASKQEVFSGQFRLADFDRLEYGSRFGKRRCVVGLTVILI